MRRPTGMHIVENRSTSRSGIGRLGLTVGVRSVVLLALTATVLSACTAAPSSRLKATGAPSAADVTLVRFNSCADALQNLRTAATRAIAAGSFAASAARGAVAAPAAGTPAGASGARGASGANPVAAGQASSAQAGAGSATSGQIGVTAPGSFSTTNTATPGVDEPDIVKTDGRRIVTITGDVLRVVDAQTQQITGTLNLSVASGYGGPGSSGPGFGAPIYALTPANLLLFGSHALVLFNQATYPVEGPPTGVGATGSAAPAGTALPADLYGPRLALVDLSTGVPQIISEYTMDGSLVDARQIGSVARVVVQSAPRIYFPPMETPGAQGGLTPDRAAIAHAGLSQWLPRYAVATGRQWHTGLVDCASVSHPAAAEYSGGSMLTVLTFDLSGTSLGDGAPVTIVADGDTVYSDGSSLYVASREWTALRVAGTASAGPPVSGGLAVSGSAVAGSPVSGSAVAGSASAAPPVTATASAPTQVTATASVGSVPAPAAVPQYTGIYKFDISGPGRPVYEASGTVPGWLLGSSGTGEYSLSAWNGALRVATTTEGFFATAEASSQSAVYVLEQLGDQLVIVGKVGGLGAGEQIYAVRFAGPVGYVVTFRQTDPLYTLDLSDPAQPRIAGQLLLNGYSAYLYPVDATHLVGIGQDTNAFGETTGTQISLFDVSDIAAPVRLAVYDLQFGHSAAEFDPHAFLYWPASRLLVIPVQFPYGGTAPVPPPVPVPQVSGPSGGTVQNGGVTYAPTSEAVVLQVGANSFTELGTITHPASSNNPYGSQMLRSLIVSNELWTLSDAGLKANDMATLTPLAWVPF